MRLSSAIRRSKADAVSIFISIWALFLFFLEPASADPPEVNDPPHKIVVLVSQKIKQYYESVEGFEERSKSGFGGEVEILELESYHNASEQLHAKLRNSGAEAIMAVGPQAASFIWSRPYPGIIRLYMMVLDPEKVLPPTEEKKCGVTLNIPVKEQLHNIKKTFPGAKTLGLIYDPRNGSLPEGTEENSASIGIKLLKMEVRSTTEIPAALDGNLGKIDVLWLFPDNTVISESLVPFIIKKAMAAKVATVGYNRFFLQSGAALSFVIDYKQTGIQASDLLGRAMKGKPCGSEPPDFESLVNMPILRMLGTGSFPGGGPEK